MSNFLTESFYRFSNNLGVVRKIIERYYLNSEYSDLYEYLSRDITAKIDSNDFLGSLQKMLISIINREISSTSSRMTSSLARDYKFILCCYSDEYIIYSTQIYDKWKEYILENHVFQTSIGGEKIFDMLDSTLIKGYSSTEGMLDIYYLILCMGYYGMYRYEDSGHKLSRYKEKLLQEIYINNAMSYNERQCNAQSYQYNIETTTTRKIKDYKRLYITYSLCISLTVSIIIIYFLLQYAK